MKILHLIDSLAYGGSAQQLRLLATAQANQQTSVEIGCLGPETPWAVSMRQANLTVHALGWTRWFDIGAALKLRSLLRETTFDVIHVWRLPALRALAAVARDLLPRAVMSAALPAKGQLAWWDRRLLAHVRCLTVADSGDRDRCSQLGIAAPMLHVVPSAFEERGQVKPSKKDADESFRIVCVGNLEPDAGFRQAIWAFDFVRQVFPNARLQIVGIGSQLAALRGLAAGLECADRVQFLGAREDSDQVLGEADMVWVPSVANTGRQVALEAMGQGRVVIASDVPCLRACVQDGVTGYLVPAGDVIAVVRRTCGLVPNESLRKSIGAAAREHVRQQYSVDAAIARWRDVYRSSAA